MRPSHEDEIRTLVSQSSVCRTLRDYKKSFECVSKAIHLDIHRPEPYFECALLYLDLSYPLYAYRTCKLALGLIYTSEYWKHIFQGFILETNHDWVGALAEYAISNSHNDTTDANYTAVFNIACMHLFQQQFSTSVTYFQQALKIQEK